jgi:16S rRNA (cytosine967-C5)-methyltransferase
VGALARAAGGLPFQVQDEAAQLVSLFAAGELAGKGGRVLDACAAPGGKAFHLAEILGPGGEVVALELHPRKADELRREAERRGLAGIRVVCADASRPVPGIEPGTFDAVLVDAPCAGLGTLRRHPELKLRRQAADLPRLTAIQRAILEAAAAFARPGAPVTYAVCSLSRAEGPEVAAGMLALGWRRAPPPPGFPADALTPEGDLLTLPHRHGCDGFYAARLARGKAPDAALRAPAPRGQQGALGLDHVEVAVAREPGRSPSLGLLDLPCPMPPPSRACLGRPPSARLAGCSRPSSSPPRSSRPTSAGSPRRSRRRRRPAPT